MWHHESKLGEDKDINLWNAGLHTNYHTICFTLFCFIIFWRRTLVFDFFQHKSSDNTWHNCTISLSLGHNFHEKQYNYLFMFNILGHPSAAISQFQFVMSPNRIHKKYRIYVYTVKKWILQKYNFNEINQMAWHFVRYSVLSASIYSLRNNKFFINFNYIEFLAF